MRRVTLSGTFLILLGVLYFLWQHRFERSPDFPTLRLADLRALATPVSGVEWLGPDLQPTLRLRVNPGHPRVIVHLDLPNLKAVDFLHLRYHVTARELMPGKEIWADGRCMIEWHPGNGETEWENDPFCSVRHDHEGWVAERVARPDHPPAIPALRIENLGVSGDLEVSLFEATVLQETWIWKIGRWVLMGAWLGWAIAWIGVRGKAGRIRTVLAACIWLLMGIYFVVPGPWKSLHSFGTPFEIGEEIKTVRDVAPSATGPRIASPAPQSGQAALLESVGEIPDKGDPALRFKHYASNVRPLLHALLLFGPTLLFACLVGKKSARSLAVLFSLAMEGAEFAFGYGFDWGDVYDLTCDAMGIFVALAVYGYFRRTAPWRLRVKSE